MNFEMYGMEHEVRNAINILLDIDALKVSCILVSLTDDANPL